MDPLQFTLMFAGFLLIAASLLLPRLLRRFGFRRSQHHPTVEPLVARSRTEIIQLEEAHETMAQVDALSSRAFARIDTRIRMLNRLVEQADARLKQLREARNA